MANDAKEPFATDAERGARCGHGEMERPGWVLNIAAV
jgi:hypothetical protein